MTKSKKDARYQPGTFAKGDDVRVAQTPSDAVRLSFDGYKRQEETKAEEAPAESTDSGTPEKTEAEKAAEAEAARTSSTPKPAAPKTAGGAK